MKRTLKILFFAFIAYTVWNSDSFRFLKGFFVDSYNKFELSSASGSDVPATGSEQVILDKINEALKTQSQDNSFLTTGEELLLVNDMINLNKIIVLQEIRAENEKNKEELRMYVLNLLQEIQSKEIRVITSEGKVLNARLNIEN